MVVAEKYLLRSSCPICSYCLSAHHQLGNLCLIKFMKSEIFLRKFGVCRINSGVYVQEIFWLLDSLIDLIFFRLKGLQWESEPSMSRGYLKMVLLFKRRHQHGHLVQQSTSKKPSLMHKFYEASSVITYPFLCGYCSASPMSLKCCEYASESCNLLKGRRKGIEEPLIGKLSTNSPGSLRICL